jgi:FAD/FMN-containing dehydrogenase
VTLGVARSHSCQFAVLGGGTSPFAGASNIDGGITIDLSLLRSLSARDSQSLLIDVGGGNLWTDVYRFLDARNLSAVGTRNSLTGVAGSILGGKYACSG